MGFAPATARDGLPETMDCSPSSVMIGWTTTADRATAEQLARGLVEARLAACAQVSGPVTSVYRWAGAIEESTEFRIAVKFAASRSAEIEAWLSQHHPYKTPQWLACPAAGSEKYLNWVIANST